MKLSKKQIAFLLAAFILAVGIAVSFSRTSTEALENKLTKIAPKVKGNPQAELKILEFLDYQCPSCAKSSALINSYSEKYPGRVYVELKYFPLRGHSHSFNAASMVECARKQGKFWEMHDKLFSTQEEWRDLEVPEALAYYENIKQELIEDQKSFNACLDDPATAEAIMQDRRDGDSIQVRSTPTFIVNGDRKVGFSSLKLTLMNFFGESQTSDEDPPVPLQ